jgi:hypothetical protein
MLLMLYRDLEEIKKAMCREVDVAAEAARLRFLTPGAGQAFVYQRKLAEAQYLMSNTDVRDLAETPFLSADGGDRWQTARDVIAAAKHCDLALTAIERLRLSAKQAIRAAKNTAEIEAAAKVDWSAI